MAFRPLNCPPPSRASRASTIRVPLSLRARPLAGPRRSGSSHIAQAARTRSRRHSAPLQHDPRGRNSPTEAQKKTEADPDVIAIHQVIEKLEKQGHVPTIKDPVAELARLQILDAGPAGKRTGKEEFQVSLTASSIDLVQDYRQPKPPATVDLVHSIKLPDDFFPKGSAAEITTGSRLDCNGTCTLTLLP